MSKKKIFYLEIIIGAIIAAIITGVLYFTEFVPTGTDIYGHLYKTEVLYDNIRSFNFYPLYTTDWYNGIQLFRYWPIFTYYVIASIMLFTKNVFMAYYVYAGVTFFVAYLGWLLISRRENKNIFVVIGILYWFLPDNLRIYFGEGNLARVMIYALLPLFFYFYTNLVMHKKNFIATTLMAAVFTATHFMLAAMCAIIFVIYGFFAGLQRRTSLYGFVSFVIGFIISGILLIPGLSGGLVSDSSSAVVDTISDWSQPLVRSLGVYSDTCCAFGFGMFILCIAGIYFASKKKQAKTGLIIGLIFFILTDSIFVNFFKQLPLSQVFWMARFVQMCYVIILYDLGRLEVPKYGKAVAVGVLGVNIALSIPLYVRTNDLLHQEEEYLLNKAVAITDNRLGLVDESTFGSYPSYYFMSQDIDYIEGWAIQGAATSDNIISLTEAVQKGYYDYAINQLVNLGADSLIVKKSYVTDYDRFYKSASDYGYVYVDESESAYLFDLEGVDGNFGVISEYNSLAIGSSSIYVSYIYPGFEQGKSSCIEDYSYEELASYDKIFLSNFTYKDALATEELFDKLSEAGVEIYIDCTHMPINVMSISEFMGVESRFLSLYDNIAFEYKDISINMNLPYEWYSTYLVPKTEDIVEYKYEYGTQWLDYIVERKNVTFIGLNMVYLCYEMNTEELYDLLDAVLDIEEMDRQAVTHIVPISVEYGSNSISIQSEQRVNTTIAFQDNFASDANIVEENNMLIVEAGITRIEIFYKYFWIGLLCSVFGYVLMMVAYWKMDLR